MLAYHLHDYSPHLYKFTESFALHWYGLAYVLGFYCSYLVMVRLAKLGHGSLKAEHVGDFITFAALFGVVLGGRLGYMLLYRLDEFLREPWIIVKLWDGGMASHGGILGLALFSLYWAKRHKISWTGIGDNLVIGGPIGIFFGRLANFVNGELYGRITDVSWAWKFPTELHSMRVKPSRFGLQIEGDEFPAKMPSSEIVAIAEKTPGALAQIEEYLPPRHPSQLYEAAGEGLLLFIILYLVRTRCKKLPDGITTGLFFVLYAIVRIAVENFRQPDSELFWEATAWEMTKGQFYSTFMIAAGLAFIVYGWVRRVRSVPGAGEKPTVEAR